SRHRTEREQQRSDGEQDRDPPSPGFGRPPRRADSWLLVLAVVAEYPPDYHAVRAHAVHERLGTLDDDVASLRVPRSHERPLHPPHPRSRNHRTSRGGELPVESTRGRGSGESA